MRPKLLEIIRRIIEEGVEEGLGEARADWEGASDEQIVDIISQAVIDRLHECFEFDGEVE